MVMQIEKAIQENILLQEVCLEIQLVEQGYLGEDYQVFNMEILYFVEIRYFTRANTVITSNFCKVVFLINTEISEETLTTKNFN